MRRQSCFSFPPVRIHNRENIIQREPYSLAYSGPLIIRSCCGMIPSQNAVFRNMHVFLCHGSGWKAFSKNVQIVRCLERCFCPGVTVFLIELATKVQEIWFFTSSKYPFLFLSRIITTEPMKGGKVLLAFCDVILCSKEQPPQSWPKHCRR